MFGWAIKRKEEPSNGASWEKRKHYRVTSEIQGSLLLDDNDAPLGCTVRDISISGLCILADRRLGIGQKIFVKLSGAETCDGEDRSADFIIIPGKVTWSRKSGSLYEAGMCFVHLSEVESTRIFVFLLREYGIELAKYPEKRRHLRHDFKVIGEYRIGDGKRRKASLRDISSTGMRLMTEEEIPAGTEIEVSFNLIPNVLVSLEGNVRRCSHNPEEGAFDVGIGYESFSPRTEAQVVSGLSYLVTKYFEDMGI
jgi:c-di-GMP-binding flagellar brake protein YcgR